MTNDAPLLELRHVSKHFTVRKGWRRERLDVLHDINFHIDHAEAVALVGESGSGKSTVARIVARLVKPDEGELMVDSRPVLREEPRRPSLGYRRAVQMIFQDPFGSLNPIYSVEHHLIRPLLRHGKSKTTAEARDRARALLESVGLAPGSDYGPKKAHELSGGQLQRVAIARALAVEPKLILADEPTSMLDVSIRAGVLNLLRELKQTRGLSFLFITHDLASARYVADRIMVMHRGRIVESGPSDRVMDHPQHEYTRRLLAAVPNPRGSLG